MTKRGFLKTEFLNELSKKLLEYNFILKKASSEFIKKNRGSFLNYSLVFLSRDEGWEINPTMGIRINSIEEIYHTTSGFEEKYQKSTPTISTSIESFLNDGKEHRFTLEEENQINNAVIVFLDIFRNISLPFFEKYSSLKAIDAVLNENPQDTSLTGAIFKGSKGLILAKLTNRYNYPELVKIYTDQYQQLADGFYLNDFKKLISILELSDR